MFHFLEHQSKFVLIVGQRLLCWETLKKYMTIFNLGRGMLIRYYAKVEPDTYFEQRNNNDDVVSSEDKWLKMLKILLMMWNNG